MSVTTQDITTAVKNGEITQADVLTALAMAEVFDKYGAFADQARKHYAQPSDDTIEIDDTPLFSQSDDGVWVSAWVYVSCDDVNDK